MEKENIENIGIPAKRKPADLAHCPNCYIDHEVDSYYSEPGGFQAFSTHAVLRPCYRHRFGFNSEDLSTSDGLVLVPPDTSADKVNRQAD